MSTRRHTPGPVSSAAVKTQGKLGFNVDAAAIVIALALAALIRLNVIHYIGW